MELSRISGCIIAENPIMIRILRIFEPIIFPMVILVRFLNAATRDVASSGTDVPIAITVKPIILSESPYIFAIATAHSTRIFPPKKSQNIHPKI